MKNLILMFLIALSIQSKAQTQTNVRQLSKIAKVWGFLKYYHPGVANGTIDWDKELLKKLVEVENLKSEAFNQKMEDWFNALPKVKLSDKVTQPKGDTIKKLFSVRDIKSFEVGKNLTNQLIQLFDYHIPAPSKYIVNKYQGYDLDYLLNKEQNFDEDEYPNREIRLLTLFRYWNIINYQYPHKDKIPVSWDAILTRYIPIFSLAKDKDAYRRAVRLLCTEMEDSHAFYNDDDYIANQQYYPSFALVNINGKYYVSSFYNLALAKEEGIKLSDEIVKINGMDVKEYQHQKLYYVNGSNVNSKNRDLALQLFKADTLKVYDIVVKRNEELMSLRIKKYHINYFNELRSKEPIATNPLWKEVEKGIWHVKYCRIKSEDELKQMFEAIKEAKAVIWDMRGYPTYGLLDNTFSSLMNKKTLIGFNDNAILDFPGNFIRTKENYAPKKAVYPFYGGPMIVLVNEQTQSLSESVSAKLSLRPNVLVLGSQTAGTTGNANRFNLPGGIEAAFTSVGVMGSKGSFVQKKGVKIDIPVMINAEEIKNNVDVFLNRALAEIKKQKR